MVIPSLPKPSELASVVKELASFSDGLQVTEVGFHKGCWETGSRPGSYTEWEIILEKRHGPPGMYLLMGVLSVSLTRVTELVMAELGLKLEATL